VQWLFIGQTDDFMVTEFVNALNESSNLLERFHKLQNFITEEKLIIHVKMCQSLM